MNYEPKANTDLREWVQKGERDYIEAKINLQTDYNAINAGICFHSQQCVEKYMKAVLVHRAISFERSHGLKDIIERLPPEVNPRLSPEEIRSLNYYVPSTNLNF